MTTAAVLRRFAELLAMPNVTGNVEDLRSNAAEIVRRFETIGASMEVVELPDASPVVVGELRCETPTATLGVYVHYDGQPVDPANWSTPPFTPTLKDGDRVIEFPNDDNAVDPEWRIYARGASDDKTPLCAIPEAISALETERTVDLVFLFEGEEESGSPNLDRYMEHLSARLQVDAWLLCDGPVHQSRAPQVAFGARGYTGFDLTIYGAEHELHSGHYGNWAPNPAMELARLLSSCKDQDGMVTIKDFYKDTRPISDADRDAISALPEVEAQLFDDLGFGVAEATDVSYPERLMIPSFNVRGLQSAAVGDAARNVLPAVATASVDIRLAAGDDPVVMLDRVKQHLEDSGYLVLDREPSPDERRSNRSVATMTRDVGYRAARIPMESPLAKILLNVCMRASGEEVVALPTFGGSVPLYLFEDLLDAPIAILPIANHDNNQHSPDENIRVANILYGIELWKTLLTSDFTGVRSTDDPLN